MINTLNLSGLKQGDRLQLSVLQNGVAFGPYQVPAWSMSVDSGKIAIRAIHRSLHQIAPDSIRFEVDLSASNFDTPGPSAGTPHYDPRMHELIYLWDMGDPGTWEEPVNVLTTWKNRNVAKGPSVKHLYRDPGNYTVSVLVVEPSSGKTATAELIVSVGNPQEFYRHADTIYINNVGDDDWSHVPVGVPEANKVNVDSLEQTNNSATFNPDAIWSQFKGKSRRWRFKRGGSWTVCIYMHSGDGPDPMFDDYGDPNKPKPEWKVKTPNSPTESVILRTGYAFDNTAAERQPTTTPPEIRIRNIHMQSNFNAVTDYGVGPPYSGALYFLGAMRCYMTGCSFNGFGSSTIYSETVGNNYNHYHELHIDDTSFSNFGGEYVVMWAGSDREESGVAFTGVRWEQIGDAKSAKGAYLGSRSSCRTAGKFTHVRGCDVFHTDEMQPGMTFWKTPRSDGALINIHSTSIEGGADGISFGGNYTVTPEGRSYTGNIIVDGLIYVGNWASGAAVQSNVSGLTARNILAICPNIPKRGNSFNGIVEIEPLFKPGVTIPDFVLDAPIKVYNCTLRMDRSVANNTYAPQVFSAEKKFATPDTPQPFTAVSEANNVLHFTSSDDPDHTLFAPLSETALWAPRCLGYRDPETGVLESQYAVPENAVQETRPLAGSAALGAALTGDVSYMDITLQKRPEPPSMGAWEAD